MQKRKIGIILGAALGAACLAGATLAMWAITDNANPLGIKITPQETQETEFSTMLLEWGETKDFTDLSDFQISEEHAKTVALKVKSTVTGSSTVTGGDLTLKVEDRTVKTGERPQKLIEHIVIEAYSTRTAVETSVAECGYTFSDKIAELLPINDEHTVTQFIDCASGKLYDVYFKIYISNKHKDNTDVTPVEFEAMRDDQLYFTVDWNRPSTIPSSEIATTCTIFVTSDTPVKCYTWSSKDGHNNDWPGKDMTYVSHGYYSFELSSEFDKIKFNWNYGTEQARESDTVTVLEMAKLVNTPCYDLGANKWVVAPVVEVLDYFLIGDHNDWKAAESNKLNKQTDGSYTITITTTKDNSPLKVMASDNATFFGENTKGTGDNTNVFVIGKAGTYDMTFYPSGHVDGDHFYYIYCVEHN